MADDKPRKPGHRVDGERYKENNTRSDGSYEVGKNRPPVNTRFAVNDGRARGQRKKGTRNIATEWREELSVKMSLTENGNRIKVTKLRATIKSYIERAIRKSDRAAETVFRFAELGEKRELTLQADDLQIIADWMDGLLGVSSGDPEEDGSDMKDAGEEDGEDGND